MNYKKHNLKPIFENERNFLNKHLQDKVHENSWRHGQSIYSNPYVDKPYLQFKAKDGEIYLKKYKEELIDKISLNEIIKKENDRLNILENESISKLKEFYNENKDIRHIASYSGGKDSDVLKLIIEKSGLQNDFEWVYCNTSNEVASTYKKVKSIKNIKIINPKKGFYSWLKEDKNYFLPTRLTRSCCAKFKEGGLKKHFDKNEELIMVLGVRRFESTKRSGYNFVMDSQFRSKYHKVDNMPKKWTNIAPIVNWTDVDVWLYILREGIKYNELYDKGYNRVGCIVCPYQHDYIDILTKNNFPKLSDRWDKILEKAYEIYHVWENYHWTFEEYKNGKWKTGTSKDGELIRLKATPERIKELAKIKDISEELAEKYFKKECAECGKKISNPHAIGLNLKLNRNTDIYYCKKCLCERLNINNKELNSMIRDFKDNGCNLF